MAISNCPQCGTPVQANATICTACGRSLAVTPEPRSVPETEAQAMQPDASSPPSTTALRLDFDAIRTRWGVEQSPALIVGLALGFIALFISTPAVISYLIAGDTEQLQKLDAASWLRFSLGLAIGAASLLLLARWQSSSAPSRTAEWPNPDLTFGLVIVGLTAFFCLAGLFKGLDESFDAQSAWFRYADVFAFLAAGWFAISRPIPSIVGSVSSQAIGLALVAAGVITLGIGQIQVLSDDFSTYVSGLSFQGAGVVAMILALAWFLGMRPRVN